MDELGRGLSFLAALTTCDLSFRNAIAGRPEQDLDKVPFVQHGEYLKVNRMLASIFATAAWRSAIAAKVDISDAGELPLMKGLREDSYRQELVMKRMSTA